MSFPFLADAAIRGPSLPAHYYGLLGVPLLLAALGAIALWVWTRQWREGQHHPRQLFIELCRGHGLTKHQQRLLLHRCRQMRLAQPALLFVDPGLWDAVLRSASGHERPALSALQSAIFAAPKKAAAPSARQ